MPRRNAVRRNDPDQKDAMRRHIESFRANVTQGRENADTVVR
jgi:hypothetical protein